MSAQRFDLDDESWLVLHQPLNQAEASQLMERLLSEVQLEERSITLFGRTMLQPRLVGWAGDIPYAYSRQTLEPRPCGPAAARLLELSNELSGAAFNHLLFNLYRDERDSMGLHADDEAELGPRPRVASWSFGAERRFSVQPKRGRTGSRLTLDLPHGSLLLMEGALQERYLHQVKKEKTVRAARLNVTCRQVFAPGP